MRGPSNERKMPSNAFDGGEYLVGGYVQTRAKPSLHFRRTVQTRAHTHGMACETKEWSRKGPRDGGGRYVGFTRGFRLLPNRKNKSTSSRVGPARWAAAP